MTANSSVILQCEGNENCSTAEYSVWSSTLQYTFGTKIGVTLIDSVTMFGDTVCNVIIALVILRDKKFWTPSNMLVTGNAIAHIVMTVCCPLAHILLIWTGRPLYCLIKGLFLFLTNYAMILSYYSMAWIRYLNVCHGTFKVATFPRMLKVFMFLVLLTVSLTAVHMAVDAPNCRGLVDKKRLGLAELGKKVDDTLGLSFPLYQIFTTAFLAFIISGFFYFYCRMVYTWYRNKKLHSKAYGSKPDDFTNVGRPNTDATASPEMDIIKTASPILHLIALLVAYSSVTYLEWTEEKHYLISGPHHPYQFMWSLTYLLVGVLDPVLYLVLSSRLRSAVKQQFCTRPSRQNDECQGFNLNAVAILDENLDEKEEEEE